jgi:pimeloyl-ACP methyl ester carboxylesterase
MWDPQMQPLSAAGFRLARLDFRDYGSRRVSARSRPRHDARTSLVSGAHDLPDFREIAATLQEILRDAKLIELDWAGHLPSLERPDRINPLLIDFLG